MIRSRLRNIVVFVLICLTAVCFAGCMSESEETAKNEQSPKINAKYEDKKKETPIDDKVKSILDMSAELKEKYEYSASDFSEEYEAYTLEDIAEMNGFDSTDELNYLTDEDGNVLFLGNMYGEEKVENEEDAFKSIAHVADLIGLGDANLTFSRKDVSVVTGNVYYTFNQTAVGYVDGEEIDAEYYSSLVKIITDFEGNLVALSSDLKHDDDLNFDYDDIITDEEAEVFIQDKIGRKRRVYEDYTELIYWTDTATVEKVSDGKTCLAWSIIADAGKNSKNNPESRPYEVFIVYAKPVLDEDDEVSPYIMESYYTDSKNDETEGSYISELFFDGMKSAGSYEYEIDMGWVKKQYPGYTGDNKIKMSVPVMYNERDELYYLGDYDRRIAVGNCYDFNMENTVNPYVTNNPEDKDSWHFYNEKNDGLDIKYFNNPDYVLSSYSTLVSVYDFFDRRYGLKGVDSTGMPILLGVYLCDEEYPEKITDFEDNAYNEGQHHDWQFIVTSPHGSCLDEDVIAHEYAHGINGELTNTKYLNASGAIMEAYADIIGQQAAILDEGYIKTNEWEICGIYSEPLRDMAQPDRYFQPKFVNGKYFVYDTESSLREALDNGGVHTNSGVCNYLAYCMVNGEPGENNQATLSMEENLDMWLECLYCSNAQTSYEDVAAYLLYAANYIKAADGSIGLTDEQYDYLLQLLCDLGVYPDENGDYEVYFDEDVKEYHVSVEYGSKEAEEDYALGVFYADDEDNYYAAGSIYEGELYYYSEKGKKLDTCVSIGDRYADICYDSVYIPYMGSDDLKIDFDVYYSSVGEEFEIDNGMELQYIYEDYKDYIYWNEDGSYTLIPEEEGFYALSFTDEEGYAQVIGVYVE